MSYSVDEVRAMKDRVADEIMKIPCVVKIEVGEFYKSLPTQYQGFCVKVLIKQSDEKSERDLVDRISKIMDAQNIPWDARMIEVSSE